LGLLQDQSKEWKKIDVSKGSCENGRHKRQKVPSPFPFHLS
jgi:hypothetical protein